MSVRTKVALELGIIAILTAVFLVLFPKRNPAMDVALAAFALMVIAFSARYTKNVIWAASPPPVKENNLKRCLRCTFWITIPTVAIFLMIGAGIAYESGGWPEVHNRIFNWRI